MLCGQSDFTNYLKKKMLCCVFSTFYYFLVNNTWTYTIKFFKTMTSLKLYHFLVLKFLRQILSSRLLRLLRKFLVNKCLREVSLATLLWEEIKKWNDGLLNFAIRIFKAILKLYFQLRNSIFGKHSLIFLTTNLE
jgi:hypothetical protein